MAVGDKYSIKVVGKLAGQTTINTFHYEITIEAGTVTAQMIRDAFATKVSSPWTTFACDDWTWTETHVQKIRPTPANLANIFLETFVGAQTGEALPPQDCAVITLYGDLARRADRGRKYIPAISEADCANGVLTAAAFVRLGNLADTFDDVITPLTVNTLRPVIHSQQLNKQPRDVFVPVVKTLARGTVRTQRRRQVGVGI